MSFVSLTVMLLFATHPHWIIPFVILMSLRYVVWNYIYKVVYGGKPHMIDEEWRMMTIRAATSSNSTSTVAEASSSSSASGSSTKKRNIVSSALKVMNPLNIVPLLKRTKSNESAANDISDHPDIQFLDRILRPHIRSALITLGIVRTPASSSSSSSSSTTSDSDSTQALLTTYQTMWSRALDQIELVYDAANWNNGEIGNGVNYTNSRLLVVGLLLAFVWCLYLPQSYLVGLIGGFILGQSTVIGQNFSEWIKLAIGEISTKIHKKTD